MSDWALLTTREMISNLFWWFLIWSAHGILLWNFRKCCCLCLSLEVLINGLGWCKAWVRVREPGCMVTSSRELLKNLCPVLCISLRFLYDQFHTLFGLSIIAPNNTMNCFTKNVRDMWIHWYYRVYSRWYHVDWLHTAFLNNWANIVTNSFT